MGKKNVGKAVRVTQVTYSRLKNLGNYENERVELTAAVSAGSDGSAETRELKRRVLRMIKGDETVELLSRHAPVCVCDECM